MLIACVNLEAKTQDGKVEASDRVYSSKEVDEKAVIDRKSLAADTPSGYGCGERQGSVLLKVVLHKSGEVTDVVVWQKSGCTDFDQRAIKAAQKVKFRPAKKGGSPVSQYYPLEYNYTAQ